MNHPHKSPEETMKAAIVTAYGAPEVLRVKQVEKPTPKPNEVLIKVYAASATTADSMMRKGDPFFARFFLGLMKPKNSIPGTGFAGVIEEVGEAVTTYQLGEAVFGETSVSFGAHAEYVCVPEDGILLRKPGNITFEEAAPVCDGALTSMNFLREIGKIKAGQRVLINGASGSLGTSAVQLAKYFGAEVTGVCSQKNAELVRSLGADHVIDYNKRDFTQAGETYDIIYDTLGISSFSKCKPVLNPDGVYLSPVLALPLLFQMLWTSRFGRKKAKFSATGLLPAPELRHLLKDIKELMKTGQLVSVIDRRYRLSEVVEAHRYVDTGHKKGNVVLFIHS